MLEVAIVGTRREAEALNIKAGEEASIRGLDVKSMTAEERTLGAIERATAYTALGKLPLELAKKRGAGGDDILSG